MRLLVAVLAVLLSGSSLVAQPLFHGEPFPLTETRYGPAAGAFPLLLSNGREPVLFWSDGENVRVTRISRNEPPASRAIFPASDFDSFDAVWTGEHFLVVGTRFPFLGIGKIIGARVAANGEPIGEPFLIIGQALLEGGHHPRVAFNGERVLLMYTAAFGFDVYMQLLTPDGLPAEPAPRPLNITTNGEIALTSNGDGFAAVIPRESEPRLVMFDRNGALRSDSVFGAYGSGLSIASDGRRYLAVGACGDGGLCGPAYARVIEQDGTIGPAVELDPTFRRSPSAVWTGTEWVVTHTGNEIPSATLQFVHLDPSAQVLSKRDRSGATDASMLMMGGRLYTAEVHGSQFFGAILIDEAPVAFAATRQTAIVTASSNDAALVVWQEVGNHRATLFAGTRQRDGHWSERELLSVSDEHSFTAQVASDGQGFLLVTSAPDSLLFAQRLDGSGNPIGDPIPLHDSTIDQIVFDGDEYLLINSSARTVARISTSGVFTSAVPLSPIVGQSARYSSDGNGNLYAVWVVSNIIDHQFRRVALAGIRIGPNLQPLAPAPSTIALGSFSDPAITFDGTQYTIAFIGTREVLSAHVSPNGATRVQRIAEEPAVMLRVQRVAGGTVIAWRNNASDFVPFVNRLSVLRRDGTFTDPITVSAEVDLALLTELPTGDLGWIESLPIARGPYEAAQRLAMRVIAFAALPQKPEAPRASLQRRFPAAVTISWTPPAQPVDGYRVESRIGEGPWQEVAIAYTPTATLRLTPGARTAFRVRAWNAAGTGAYSEVVTVGNPRRRAVR